MSHPHVLSTKSLARPLHPNEFLPVTPKRSHETFALAMRTSRLAQPAVSSAEARAQVIRMERYAATAAARDPFPQRVKTRKLKRET